MKSIVVCGSKKYKEDIKRFCNKLRKFGVFVFEPNIQQPVSEDSFFHSDHITKAVFKGFTLEHFDWIRKADVCFIFNKDNYVGTSVTLEIGYASALSKPIFALNAETGDPCRDSLIDKEVKTFNELLSFLQ